MSGGPVMEASLATRSARASKSASRLARSRSSIGPSRPSPGGTRTSPSLSLSASASPAGRVATAPFARCHGAAANMRAFSMSRVSTVTRATTVPTPCVTMPRAKAPARSATRAVLASLSSGRRPVKKAKASSEARVLRSHGCQHWISTSCSPGVCGRGATPYATGASVPDAGVGHSPPSGSTLRMATHSFGQPCIVGVT